MNNYVLELKDLAISFYTKKGEVEAVRGINLTLKKGEILCIVGESGCGKTVMCQSIMHLLPSYGIIKQGSIKACGVDITNFNEKQMRNIRGKKISMVIQDPFTTLNPTIPIGKQITEAILKHKKISKSYAKIRAIELMEMVGIRDAKERYKLQPHFFSGGMRQRCVLAIALASEPDILFADEVTTALDVTVKAMVLELLKEIREKTGIAIVFVTHDFGAASRIADTVAVMYAGKIIEIGKKEEVFNDPRHPYTWGLLGALPSLALKTGRLKSIPGMPPSLQYLLFQLIFPYT